MPAKKKTAEKKIAPKKTAAKKTAQKKQPESVEPELSQAKEEVALELTASQAIEDPIGDETDGEAAVSISAEMQSEAGKPKAERSAGPNTEQDPETDDPEVQEPNTEPIPVGDPEPDSQPYTDPDPDEGDEEEPGQRPPAKLDRLQKILAQAGIASRRAAEKLIEEGRVQVNGKVVTELGTKADGGRDHIRVDGKLLHGAERLRYFVLNKPKGFVTTVKDPEGRPTVMQFFDKMRERLYPVGRLDYLSEGLLLVTNDGELANRLTKAASGVEKTYLVKVAGVPTEEELDRIRGGLTIDKGKPGEGRVRTSPARVRQVRQGDNPWYEVVLVEGRNRELRKMFEEIGHFVEKIRRVGYGPLVLDQEPGKLRELDEHELTLLRKTADGTLRAGKGKAAVRVKFEDSLPAEKPAARSRVGKPGEWKKGVGKKSFGSAAPQRRPGGPKPFSTGTGEGRPFAAKPFEKTGEGRPFEAKPFEKRQSFDKRKPFGGAKPGFGRSADRPGQSPGARPAWKRDERAGTDSGGRPPQRFGAGARGEGARGAGSTGAGPTGEAQRPSSSFGGKSFGARPAGGRTFAAKPAFGRPFAGKPAAGRNFGDKARGGAFGDGPPSGGFGEKPAGRPFGDRSASGGNFGAKPAWRKSGDRPTGSFGSKPAWKKSGDRPSGNFERKTGGSDRTAFKRTFSPRSPAAREDTEPMNFEARKPSRLRIEPVEHTERREDSRPERSSGPRQFKPRPFAPRPFTPGPESGRGGGGRASGGGARAGRGSFGRASSGREGGGSRSESPRPIRSEGGLARPFTTSSGMPRAGGARPSSRPGKPSGAGWKPKPGFKSGPKSGARSGSGPGGSSKGGFKGKPGGRPGGRPGGKRRGWAES
jgi:23S rRNA pseudouridine2605 synthase